MTSTNLLRWGGKDEGLWRMKYSFEVTGLPPKKDGANSMWKKENSANKIIKLRKKARKEFELKRKILTKNIKLSLKIYLNKNTKQIGDLDNFIGGVCDSLMFADKKAKIHSNFKENPKGSFRLIEEDFQIIKISAEKKINSNNIQKYSVKIEGDWKKDLRVVMNENQNISYEENNRGIDKLC